MKNKILVILMLAVGSVAMAKSYGDAGCGLGSLIFNDSPGIASQVFAATSNNFSATNMFGISSGTSNCVDNGTVKDTQAVPMFIEVNKEELAKDAARGNGETLAGLAQLMGCDSAALNTAVKSHYKKLFIESNMQPAAIESGISEVVTADHVSCGA